MAAVFHKLTQTVSGFLACAVQGRGHDHPVPGKAFGVGVGRYEVAFHIEFEQRVIHIAHHVVVLEAATEREAGFDEEPVQRGQRFIGDHDGHLIALLQVDETLPHFWLGDFATEYAGLTVGRVRFQVVAQQAFPVGFE